MTAHWFIFLWGNWKSKCDWSDERTRLLISLIYFSATLRVNEEFFWQDSERNWTSDKFKFQLFIVEKFTFTDSSRKSENASDCEDRGNCFQIEVRENISWNGGYLRDASLQRPQRLACESWLSNENPTWSRLLEIWLSPIWRVAEV